MSKKDEQEHTSIIAFSPRGSVATQQQDCGNCGFLSSTKTIIHNIIVVSNKKWLKIYLVGL